MIQRVCNGTHHLVWLRIHPWLQLESTYIPRLPTTLRSLEVSFPKELLGRLCPHSAGDSLEEVRLGLRRMCAELGHLPPLLLMSAGTYMSCWIARTHLAKGGDLDSSGGLLRKTPDDQRLEEMGYRLGIHIDRRNGPDWAHNCWDLVEGLEVAVDN